MSKITLKSNEILTIVGAGGVMDNVQQKMGLTIRFVKNNPYQCTIGAGIIILEVVGTNYLINMLDRTSVMPHRYTFANANMKGIDEWLATAFDASDHDVVPNNV